MKNIEEYLYYHENQDYINLKFLSCTYYKTKQRLVVRYIYNAEIEESLPSLQKRLEELFMQRVGLPLKYDFVYKKVFVDALSLQLEIVSFLRKKYGAMTDGIQDNQVSVEMQGRTWSVDLFLPSSLIDFLQYSQPWKKFQQDLVDRNFHDFDFHFKVA
ncbi:MAG: hypothetical protein IJ295_01770 [Clostridia bacterium]|nr:hypothetical protein [Clostridia bacterium]